MAVAPYYTGSCVGVPCPANSSGVSVLSGCSCSFPNFAGVVAATTTPPYYTSNCTGVLSSCAAERGSLRRQPAWNALPVSLSTALFSGTVTTPLSVQPAAGGVTLAVTVVDATLACSPSLTTTVAL